MAAMPLPPCGYRIGLDLWQMFQGRDRPSDRQHNGVRLSDGLFIGRISGGTANSDLSYTLLNSKVLLKYAVLHLAELALLVGALIVVKRFIGIPTWLIITILALWIIKDMAMFTKVWRAYSFEDNDPMRQLIGLEATVMVSLNPIGYVRARGELWKAEVRNPLYPAKRGERTRVIDIKGMTLIVERCNDDPAPIS